MMPTLALANQNPDRVGNKAAAFEDIFKSFETFRGVLTHLDFEVARRV